MHTGLYITRSFSPLQPLQLTRCLHKDPELHKSRNAAGELEALQGVMGEGDQTQMLSKLVSRVATLEGAAAAAEGARRQLHNQLVELRGNVSGGCPSSAGLMQLAAGPEHGLAARQAAAWPELAPVAFRPCAALWRPLHALPKCSSWRSRVATQILIQQHGGCSVSHAGSTFGG